MGIIIGRSQRLEGKPQCPVCAMLLDGYASVGGEARLEPGDFTVCGYCSTILCFEPGPRFRKATPEELEEMRNEAPETFGVLERIVGAARCVMTDRRRKNAAQN